ncbi:helix-turn-helix domain-containing protein [Halobacillus seohaensis]|uniref:Helix-turn-helix domain-containing protein n=1 Tax=Halobacillus seohaensis TaxID=447421 RepID=A0ABW2EN32_9BACI
MIGDRIKESRKTQKLSMGDLAEKTGFAKSYISSIERAVQSNPTIQFVEKIALGLNVSVDYLIHGNEKVQSRGIDEEWVELVLESMDYGLSKQQFREYLELKKANIL